MLRRIPDQTSRLAALGRIRPKLGWHILNLATYRDYQSAPKSYQAGFAFVANLVVWSEARSSFQARSHRWFRWIVWGVYKLDEDWGSPP